MKSHFIFSVLFFVFVSTFAQKQTLTLEDAILYQGGKLLPEKLNNVAWIPTSKEISYTVQNAQTLLSFSLSGKVDTLLKIDDIRKGAKYHAISNFNGYTWMDENTLFLKGEKSGYAYNVKEKTESRLFEELPGIVTASGTHKTANRDVCYETGAQAFTRDNNLFLLKGDEETVVVRNKDKNIVAGQSISRNEFGISKGTFWSPSGNMLAFYEKDETAVSEYPLLDINTTPGSLNSIKYPMAGQKSEVVSVGIFHVLTSKVIYLKSTKAEFDYMTNLAWDPSENFVYVAELNRAQNHMKLNKYSAITGDFVATLFEEKSETWVEPEHAPYFIDGQKDKFIWLSERDGFMNLYLYKTDGKLVRQLTRNKWVTKEIIGQDEKGKYVFYSGTGKNPTETNLYKVEISSGKQSLLTLSEGTNTTLLSPDGKYFLNNFSNTFIVNNVSIRSAKDGYLKQHVFSAENPLKDFETPSVEITTLKSADGETDLYARVIKPSNFDSTKTYPVLVYLYGGPHAQQVTNSWLGGAKLWMYVQAQRGYIIFTVDNRGSAYRGEKFEKIIHRQLGDAELEDQVAGVNYLKSLPYVDANKMAIHGWSYGGFMTTSMMLRNPDLFQVGVAGGPVTDWKYYEVMYGERYMDTPVENPVGYKKASVMNYVKRLKGNLLLIHGNIDNVVLMQHNLKLIEAFVDEGIQVDFFVYPNHPHNVRGKDRIHLMTKVLNYIDEKLKD